jgi:hypothetical protein
MSDIGPLPGLDRAVTIFFWLLIVGPPVVLGIVFLLLRLFFPKRGWLWTVLYFLSSCAVIITALLWWADTANDPEWIAYSVPVALASSAAIFGLFLGVRRLIRSIRGKTGGDLS